MEYVKRRNLLLQPSKQSHLVQEIPEVVVEDAEHHVNFANSNERSEVGTAPSCNDPSGAKVAAAACKQINVGSPANRASQPSTQENQCDIVTSPENQASSEPVLEEECCPSQICTCKGLQRRNGDVTNEGKIEVMHMSLLEDSNSIPLAKEKQGPEAEHNMVVEQKLGAIQVFDSCDKDDEGGAIQLLDLSYDEKIARMNSRQLERAQTEAAEWYCMGPEGDTRGPYKMSFLKCWNEICTHPHRFKAWKIGQGPKRGVPLPDACRSV